MALRERGTAVHAVLERFWEQVKTQANLKAMPVEERRELLIKCIHSALAKTAGEEPTRWDRAYLETQRTRLLSLCSQWLDLELTRQPFTVIQREQASRDVSIGPLRLSLRIDRIDEVANGHVLIDYKTGEANPSAWLTDRPDQPQIPLYAVLAEYLRLDAIGFANIRPGDDMAFTGYQDTPGTLTKVPRSGPASLEIQLEDWSRILTNLANGFAQGDTRVSPKRYPVTCEFCAQRLICRLDVPSLELAEEGPDSPEAASARGPQ